MLNNRNKKTLLHDRFSIMFSDIKCIKKQNTFNLDF